MKIARASFLICGLLLFAVFLFGCAGRVYAPKNGIMYYHKELPDADRAIEAARSAGKDKECPAEFQSAAKMRDEAYKIYWACRTQEAIAKANEAAAKANGLCPKKAEAPMPKPAPPPPPPPPAAAPTVSISATPASIDQGKCADLKWSSTHAAKVSIDQGVGSVDPSGTKQVCPGSTTMYTVTAAGEGGSRTATTTVTVNPPPAPKVVDRMSLHINFDSNKADIRKADVSELQKAIDFIKKYPGTEVSIEGHTDSKGDAKYNQGLSERRALAVKDYLVKKGGLDGSRMKTAGYGEIKPIADNKTKKGQFENRRVEVLILSE
jgi:OOP family OmpA-OmpF porin